MALESARQGASVALLVWAALQLLPGRADFGALPPPVLVRSVRELRERLAGAPPECLRPRRLADGVVAFAIAEVVDLGYAAAEQTCHARLLDASGEALEVRLEHRTVAPHALESFAAALSQGARFVTGHARWDGSAVWLDALAVATDEALVVPDLAERTPQRAIAPRPLADPQGPLAPVLSAAGHVLAEVAHHGFARLPRDYGARLRQAIGRCEDCALLDLSERLRRLGERLHRLAASGGSETGPRCWADAALCWELLRA